MKHVDISISGNTKYTTKVTEEIATSVEHPEVRRMRYVFVLLGMLTWMDKYISCFSGFSNMIKELNGNNLSWENDVGVIS